MSNKPTCSFTVFATKAGPADTCKASLAVDTELIAPTMSSPVEAFVNICQHRRQAPCQTYYAIKLITICLSFFPIFNYPFFLGFFCMLSFFSASFNAVDKQVPCHTYAMKLFFFLFFFFSFFIYAFFLGIFLFLFFYYSNLFLF